MCKLKDVCIYFYLREKLNNPESKNYGLPMN